jgi:hypothetical protein
MAFGEIDALSRTLVGYAPFSVVNRTFFQFPTNRKLDKNTVGT